MMRKGPTLKATAKRRVSRGLMVVREARCVSLSPVSRLARIGAAWSALATRPLRAKTIGEAALLLPPNAAARS
jgi:hypothetical protein